MVSQTAVQHTPQLPSVLFAVRPAVESPAREAPARVLVVDDSNMVRTALRAILTGPGLGAQVVDAQDGASALRAVLAQELDAVLCDVTMPGMDGLTFLRAVRQHRTRLELPVLMLTSLNSQQDRVMGLRLGASDYITKPPDPVELIARTELHVQMARLSRQLTFFAERDVMTGLHNRRVFLERLGQELQRSVRSGEPPALLVLDVDHFKRINDTHGHPVGDAVLKDLAAAMVPVVRPYDTVGRLGGEEFGVLLPGANTQGATAVAQRVREAIKAASLGGLPAGAVTVSIGLAVAYRNTTAASLYATADAQLYQAKHSGRDCVRG